MIGRIYSLPALLEMLREPCGLDDCGQCEIERQAADEIDRLRAELDAANTRFGDMSTPTGREIELRLQLAAAEARAAYWHHDAFCHGGCSECKRLSVAMEAAAEKARTT